MLDHGTSSDECMSSDNRRNSSGSNPQNIKRRASRAGTRSVSTLTASQLERKRANDREAQRAIRQRTRDYIDQLEKQVSELDAKRDELTSVMQRNAALEAEIAQLRCQVHLGGYCLTCNGSTYSPARASSTTESVSSADYSPDLESATSMDDRSIDATARLMAEAGFLLGPYTLSGASADHWDRSRNDHPKLKEIDELMEDEYEHETTAFVISADPPSSRT